MNEKTAQQCKLLRRYICGVPCRIRTCDHMLSVPLQLSLPSFYDVCSLDYIITHSIICLGGGR